MTRRDRARLDDVHEIAGAMPYVKRIEGPKGNPIYQVGGKSFVFFRTPQPDAVDPESGERYPDVIMIWVDSESDKLALVQDPRSPFFTTDRFDDHPSVLLRASRLGEISRGELRELIQDAWLSRVSSRRAEKWLAEHGGGG
ncbi:MmcQ/YjbR family DNA-binding protein [Mycobacterium sp. LTG2003]